MKLSSVERSVECAWGSTFSDNRISVHGEYSDWNEEYAPHYLAKQQEYVKELTEIDGKSAKIQTWPAVCETERSTSRLGVIWAKFPTLDTLPG
jgi:hypothetical protein